MSRGFCASGRRRSRISRDFLRMLELSLDTTELDRIAKLDHVLRSSLLEKVERLWPARLQQLAAARKRQKQQDKADVQQFVLKLTNAQDH